MFIPLAQNNKQRILEPQSPSHFSPKHNNFSRALQGSPSNFHSTFRPEQPQGFSNYAPLVLQKNIPLYNENAKVQIPISPRMQTFKPITLDYCDTQLMRQSQYPGTPTSKSPQRENYGKLGAAIVNSRSQKILSPSMFEDYSASPRTISRSRRTLSYGGSSFAKMADRVLTQQNLSNMDYSPKLQNSFDQQSVLMDGFGLSTEMSFAREKTIRELELERRLEEEKLKNELAQKELEVLEKLTPRIKKSREHTRSKSTTNSTNVKDLMMLMLFSNMINEDKKEKKKKEEKYYEDNYYQGQTRHPSQFNRYRPQGPYDYPYPPQYPYPHPQQGFLPPINLRSPYGGPLMPPNTYLDPNMSYMSGGDYFDIGMTPKRKPRRKITLHRGTDTSHSRKKSTNILSDDNDDDEEDEELESGKKTRKKHTLRSRKKSNTILSDEDTSEEERESGKKTKKKHSKKGKGESESETCEAEHQKDPKEEKRKNAHKNLRVIGWTMIYSQLMFANVKEEALKKRAESHRQISEKIARAEESFKEFVISHVGKLITQMYMDGAGFNFVNEKPLSESKYLKMLDVLAKHLKGILDKLIFHTKTLPGHFFDFLSEIDREHAVLPFDYLTEFELKRLQFNYFGGLKNMNPQKSKMLIASVVIIRMFIHGILMRPKALLKVNPSPVRLLNIGSLLYNLTMDIIRTSTPVYPKNQDFLTIDLRIKPRANLLKSLDSAEELEKRGVKKESVKDNDIVEGFYTRHQMECILKEKNPNIDSIKALLQGWIDTIYKYALEENRKK